MPWEAQVQAHPAVGHAIVVGDHRPYLTALLVADPDVEPRSAAELDADPVPRPSVDLAMARANASVSAPEQVRVWTWVGPAPSAESGTLTPTMKVRRTQFRDEHADAIERLYSAQSSPR